MRARDLEASAPLACQFCQYLQQHQTAGRVRRNQHAIAPTRRPARALKLKGSSGSRRLRDAPVSSALRPYPPIPPWALPALLPSLGWVHEPHHMPALATAVVLCMSYFVPIHRHDPRHGGMCVLIIRAQILMA